jgi:hypothetical protein
VNRSDLFIPGRCGWEVVDIHGTGRREVIPAQAGMIESCCYEADIREEEPGCVIGRPYFDGGVELRAPLRSMADVSPLVDAARAAAWANAGAAEHASVAAFARLALELLRFGAPTGLLRAVQEAALDEIAHAESCWRLAARFGGKQITAGPFPFPAQLALDADLSAIAAAAVREGCLAETLGAHVAAIAAEHAPEPDVREALQSIAADEARHAVLSFRIVAWALRVGGGPVRSAVTAAFEATWPELDVHELALRSGVDAAMLEAGTRACASDVVEPARASLLAA